MSAVDYIPYITMIMGLSAVVSQYNSFINSKDMSNVPYVGLFGMLFIGSLSYIYASNKSLPLIPVYVNLLVAIVLIGTKIAFKETNVFNAQEKTCED